MFDLSLSLHVSYTFSNSKMKLDYKYHEKYVNPFDTIMVELLEGFHIANGDLNEKSECFP